MSKDLVKYKSTTEWIPDKPDQIQTSRLPLSLIPVHEQYYNYIVYYVQGELSHFALLSLLKKGVVVKANLNKSVQLIS